jgi:hypothetical protein
MFPEECRHVREEFATVYHYDSQTTGMTPEQRRAHHQLYSAPVLDRLQNWIHTQFEQRRVEPNSALGKALAYLQRHWEGLTQFLRLGNAPLDTNAVERALKRAVLHRNYVHSAIMERRSHRSGCYGPELQFPQKKTAHNQNFFRKARDGHWAGMVQPFRPVV